MLKGRTTSVVRPSFVFPPATHFFYGNMPIATLFLRGSALSPKWCKESFHHMC